MRLISLSFHGVGKHAETTITDNRAVIAGAVGVGKSKIVDLVEIALTGAAPRGNLIALTNAKSPTGSAVTGVFEHGGVTFRGVATCRKGKQTHLLERANGESWEPVKSIADVIGVDAETLRAASFLRCKGVDGHGTFGPSGSTGRRKLLSTLDRELPRELFAEWAQGAGIALPLRERIETLTDGVVFRAVTMGDRAKNTGRDVRAKLDAVNQGVARLDEVRLRMAGDQVTVGAPAGEAVDLTGAEAELDEARRLLATAKAEAERNGKLHASRNMMIAQRSDAQTKLDALGDDPARMATAKLAELRPKWLVGRDAGEAHAQQANALESEANALESTVLAAWSSYRHAEGVYSAAARASQEAAAKLAAIEAAAGSVVVPCGAAAQYRGCKFLTGVVGSREALPAAKAEAARLAAILAEAPKPTEPDTDADKANIATLRAEAAKLRKLQESCKATCAAIAAESVPLKEAEKTGSAEADRLRAIISEPLPEDPGEAQDCAPFAANVAECEAVVRELRAKRDASAGAEALRVAARERIVAAEARVATLQSTLAADRAESETLSALERFYREAPRLAIKSTLRDIEGAANASLERAGFDLMVRLAETEPDAKGLWEVAVYVGDALRETLSEGQLLAVDLALSAGYRAHVGLDWYAVDDGFGALGGDEAERITTALDDGWVVSHKPEVTLTLRDRGWARLDVYEDNGVVVVART
jgi:DNA repair exonuclease SbcCD ATPase subunit